MSAFFNRVKFTSSTAGAAAFGVGSAVTGFRTPATASVSNGTAVSYTAENADRSQWETGHGTYNTAGPTISRTTILENSSGTTSAINFSVAPTVWLDFLAQDVGRTLLTADRTYYVATTGSDSNTGLSGGAAWLTLQHAVNVVSATLDLAGFTVTISIGSGSFAGCGLKSMVGGGALYFLGNGVSNTTIISGPGDGTFNAGECFSAYFNVDTVVWINAVTLASSNNNNIAIYECRCTIATGNPASPDLGTGSVTHHGWSGSYIVFVEGNDAHYLSLTDTTTISAPGGTCPGYIATSAGALFNIFENSGITISGTPAWSFAFVSAGEASLIDNSSFTTFSGSATGPRYNVQNAGVINSGGSGANWLPGDTPGMIASGGIYCG